MNYEGSAERRHPGWDGGKYISSRGTSHLQLCQINVKEYGSRNPSIN